MPLLILTYKSAGEYILPMVPIVINTRNGDKGRKKEREKYDAEFCNVTTTVKCSNFPC